MSNAYKKFKRFISISNFIWNHPLASKRKIRCFYNFFMWQIVQKINPRPRLMSFVENSSLFIEKGMAGATGNIYTGLLEFEDISFVLHTLQPGDLFADIGANVGVYSILASKNRGAESISFEPVASTFNSLKRNLKINHIEHLVNPIQKGVGEKTGMLSFTSNLDSVNHVVNSDQLNKTIVQIPIVTLNEIFENRYPQLMKIDVEGFEWNVLKGGEEVLNSNDLKAIIIELNGSGMRYGFSDQAIHQLLVEKKFIPYQYEPFSRVLIKLNTFGQFNTIYIKNLDWVRARIQTNPKFHLLGQKI